MSGILDHLRCALTGHRWHLALINLEGHKVWQCRRCGLRRQGALAHRADRPGRGESQDQDNGSHGL